MIDICHVACYIFQIGLSYVALFIIPCGIIHLAVFMKLSISIRNDYSARPVMS